MDLYVKDIGPVEEFEYCIDRPGIHELRGAQGVGKTTILRTVQRLVDRDKADVSKRDGTKKGEATLGDTRTIKVGRVVREEMNEDDILGVGDMNLAELHTPRFKDAVARDKSRIANLIHLSDAPVDFAAFRDLLGSDEQFDAIVGSDAEKAGGLLEVAGKVKRAIESTARDVDKQRKTAEDNVKSLRNSLDGVDLEVECDNDKLMEAFQQATEAYQGLVSEKARVEQLKSDAKADKEKLAGITTPDLDAIEASMTRLEQTEKNIKAQISGLEDQIAQLKADLGNVVHQYELESNKHASAVELLGSINIWKGRIEDASKATEITDDQIAQAKQAMEDAKKAQADGLVASRMKGKAAELEAEQEAVKSLKRKEQELRDKAKSVFDIVAQAVEKIDGCPLRVAEDDNGDFRVVIKTDRSDAELFEDLSDGERWEVIIPLCAGENRVVVIPQAAYGELQPATRKKLHQLAKKSGAYILTAVADDCELSARYFEDEPVTV